MKDIFLDWSLAIYGTATGAIGWLWHRFFSWKANVEARLAHIEKEQAIIDTRLTHIEEKADHISDNTDKILDKLR